VAALEGICKVMWQLVLSTALQRIDLNDGKTQLFQPFLNEGVQFRVRLLAPEGVEDEPVVLSRQSFDIDLHMR
jgi:hypothetical protein